MAFGLGPFGVGPFGAGGDDGEALYESIVATGVSLGDFAPYLRDTMSVAGAQSVQAALQSALADGAQVSEAVVLAMAAYAEGAATVDDTLASVHGFLGAIEDALVVTGLVETVQQAHLAVIEAAALETLLQAGWTVHAVSSAEFQTALLNELRIQVALAAEAAVAAAATPYLRLTVLPSDTAVATDAPVTRMDMIEALTDGAAVFVSLRLGDVEYAGWVLNTQLRAVTEYRNFAFNSFAQWQGRYYGFREEGLYLLEGDDDDGTPIEAWIRTALETFGTNRWKRVPDLYLGLKADGNLLVKAITRDDETGEITEDWYVCEPADGAGYKPARVKLGRGMEAPYMGWELRNIDGADFALDEISWRPLVLGKRI